ncbi:MAG: hypothetical protein HQL35_09235 [Alphaproteobacteria bacterium]|nr:hypothetical protein [Alphaproteobacteria bacterium]
MTRFEPALWLRRFIVFKDGEIAYDETFHLGVNVIRSEGNSKGKSTIADLIFFALGGDFADWKAEAGSCTNTIAEVFINGGVVTLKRDITGKNRQPMLIHYGDMESALATATDWKRYPYNRASDRESYSQILFDMLGLPEVPAELSGNITMHQCLRLMYVDQLTPVFKIFRMDEKDSAIRRQAVGDLLCGAFDPRIYQNQLELRLKERQYEAINQQLEGAKTLLATAEDFPTLQMMDQHIQSVLEERGQVAGELDELRGKRRGADPFDTKGQEAIEALKQRLDEANAILTDKDQDISELRYTLQDSDALIVEIERNLRFLDQGNTVRETFGPLAFHICPSCFGPVKQSSDHEHCHLCKEPLESEQDRTRYMRIRNELNQQIRESKYLREARAVELTKTLTDRNNLIRDRDQVRIEYLSLARNYVSDVDTQVDTLSSKLGALNNKLTELDKRKAFVAKLQGLIDHKQSLNDDISALKEEIEALERKALARRQAANTAISRKMLEILSSDTETEEFEEVTSATIDFEGDNVYLEGKTSFSASTLNVIRNAMRVAMFQASIEDPKFNFPRFLLMDNIEDKGMTEGRSQNFQRMLVDLSRSLEREHQIIFTTSMVADDLDIPELTIGEKFTAERKSLRTL